jgi:hypothetical protein
VTSIHKRFRLGTPQDDVDYKYGVPRHQRQEALFFAAFIRGNCLYDRTRIITVQSLPCCVNGLAFG